MNTLKFSRFVSVACMAALSMVLCANDAQARTRKSTHTGPKGTAQSQVDRSPGNVKKSSTFTGQNGQTTTHEANRTTDLKTGSVNASASTTLPDGRTASRSLQSERTDTGRSTTGTATGFNGKTATIDSTTTRTDSGHNRQTTVTGPNGGKQVTTVDVTRQDGTTTRTVDRAVTPPSKP
jgi:hypothetical protein